MYVPSFADVESIVLKFVKSIAVRTFVGVCVCVCGGGGGALSINKARFDVPVVPLVG